MSKTTTTLQKGLPAPRTMDLMRCATDNVKMRIEWTFHPGGVHAAMAN